MPEPEIVAQTCPLCLNADERPSMLMVPLPHFRLAINSLVVLCRPCAEAVATVWFYTQVEEVGAEKAAEQIAETSLFERLQNSVTETPAKPQRSDDESDEG